MISQGELSTYIKCHFAIYIMQYNLRMKNTPLGTNIFQRIMVELKQILEIFASSCYLMKIKQKCAFLSLNLLFVW